ncbi:hypothetical protein Goarm_004072 [Gossypium armourianum]|uniref:Uncharacterized protein n=1 Tax=Gossypium armourianum TaxID=34283 RepID=A0A7J9K554_9ROSI|nr:hypothetical protein [Gossypium armourianum]
MAANTVSLKLLVDSTSQRVLFAESGKDFVDFMFNILSLPIGSVIKLLTKEQMPIVPNNAANVPPLLPTLEFSKPIGIYRCGNYLRRNCGLYVSSDSKFICPSCNNVMNQTATNVNPKKKPMSAISCFTLLNKFNIKDVGVLQEKTIDIGMDECVKLLKASFQYKTVLSNVFLEKKMDESNASSSSGVNSIVT